MRRYRNMLTLFCTTSLGVCFADRVHPELPSQEITPLATSLVHNWAEFFVTADFIYWQAREDGLSFAQEGDYAFSGNPPATGHRGSFKDVNFEYEPGFKAGVGVDFRHDGWSLLANYTWLEQFDIRGSASNHPGTHGQLTSAFLLTIIPQEIFPLGLASAHARWKLRFNAIDLELARSFYISSRLVLKPFIGAKYAWIDQKYRVNSVGVGQPFDFSLTSRFRQDYWGIGVRGGLNTEWHFTRNWSLYGNLAISELYSQFQSSRKDIETAGSTPGVLYAAEHNFHTMKPVLEMGVGFRYETFFSDDRYQLFFQAGWEQQLWFDHNQLIAIGYNFGEGDLSFQGCDVKFGFSF